MSSRTLSFRDILKASWLQGLNEIQLLDIARDVDVYRVLEETGFDIDYPVEYYGAQHRDLTGKVAIGLVACGEVSCNRKHLNSAYSSTEDLLIASSFIDPSLTKELANLRGLSRSYEQDHSLEVESGVGQATANYTADEDTGIAAQIAQLNDLVELIRGPKYNSAGSLKTQEEYAQYAIEREQEKE